MTRRFAYALDTRLRRRVGLIVLQTDETVEMEVGSRLPPDTELFVTRIPSAPEVSLETLAGMEAHISDSARLFPENLKFDAIGYCCTSGAAQIGSQRVAELVQLAAQTGAVFDPVSALIAKCHAMKLHRLAFLSPYVASVSDRVREVLQSNGIETPVFGSFDVAEESIVARIDEASVKNAALDLASMSDIEALFVSCTNLRTMSVAAELEEALGMPVLSSNSVLADSLYAADRVIGPD